MSKTIKYILSATILILVSGDMSFSQAQSGSFKVPVYEKFSLPNGLIVYLMEQHEVPTISVSAIIPAGAIYNGQKSGLASITATALQFGTKSYTKAKIESELDFIGARINTYASKESASLTAKFASKDQDIVLPIIKEVLADPVFDAAEFEKEKKRSLATLDRIKESPRSVLGFYWDHFLYGDHVYGYSSSGSPASVAKFSVSDLKTFYKINYSPAGSALAVVGDFESKSMKDKLSKIFSKWEKSVEPQKNLAGEPIATIKTGRVLLINKEDARETTLLIGGPGIRRDNPDFVAIEVVNTVLGGRFTSWLNDELRVNSGLTYGANSYFSPLKNAGTFSVSTFTATKTTEPTIDKALQVLNRLHAKGIDEETLTSAKNYVKGQFPPDFETATQLAGLLTEMFWYGFDESFINNFQNNVDGLTSAKAKDIILKYFPDKNLQLVLIGKASEIKRIAEKYGPVTVKEIKADGY